MAGPKRAVLLVGAGHAHLALVLAAGRFRQAGAELTLIDPGRFWYSGRAAVLLGGLVREAEDTVDPGALCRSVGVRFVQGRANRLDGDRRELVLETGRRLPYDLVSFNAGSVVDIPFPVESTDVWPVKPIAGLPALKKAIERASRSLKIVVAGGGATGCEIAGNLIDLGRSRPQDLAVTLVSSGPRLVETGPPGASAWIADNLAGRGAELLLGRRIASVRDHQVVLEDGSAIGFDHLVLATGLKATPLVSCLGVPFVRKGGVRVAPTLRSVGDERVFAAGDCAAIEGYDLPKIGVYGVRAAPILEHNLLASLADRPLRRYRPQRRYLSILDIGDGTGLAMRGRLWLPGRAVARLKHWIDGRFLRRYQDVAQRE
ncbi:NAD(P)/FAD-dependent oxidoreductase [Consotaella aegiceratis]|uniref:NAD(P)/FAD-dependent oxidoreductase n=1 Tax=Consotaella aegiceratis TaxID=3097961 RepID=UPI002F424AA6